MTPEFLEAFVWTFVPSWIAANIGVMFYSMHKDQVEWIKMLSSPLGVVGFLIIVCAGLWISVPAFIYRLAREGVVRLKSKKSSEAPGNVL